MAEVIVAVLGLLVQLIVHWELCESVQFFAPKILEDGSVDKGNAIDKATNSGPSFYLDGIQPWRHQCLVGGNVFILKQLLHVNFK